MSPSLLTSVIDYDLFTEELIMKQNNGYLELVEFQIIYYN